MPYISCSSDFASYIEDYLMYERQTFGYDETFDLKVNVVHDELYFMVQ